MATVWLVTNGGDGGQCGDDWLVDTIHTTQAGAVARAAGERWFKEVEEWQIHGPLLTSDEESAIRGALGWLLWCDENSHLNDEGRKDIATLRGLLERTK
jgi:hypothetical protein